jgi:acetyltransferase-like isoleucine patch superfamily enzyme
MVASEYRNVTQAPVYIHKYSVVGCNSSIMPGTVLHEGVALGANSFVPIDTICNEWCIYAGTPVRYLKPRSKGLLEWTN